jgi:transposase InsO family protein
MPFGLSGASQTMAALMDKVLGSDLEPYVYFYLDDVIIATETFEDHVRVLKDVANRLKSANLSVNLKKSHFTKKSVKFLGYVLSEKGLTVDPEKIRTILSYPAPKNIRECRRLMGVAGWYQRFIKDFSLLTAPITELMKKNLGKFRWTEEAEKAFNQIKECLMSEPILANPDFSLPFKIQCDASDIGVSGVLTQNFTDGEHSIAYFSRKLTVQERKFTTTEKECLAVLNSIEKFRGYIEGVKFSVITDHSSLTWLMTLKDPPGRLARWVLKMQAHDFDIIFRPGKSNQLPDALSRAIESLDLQKEEIQDHEYASLMAKVQTDPAKYSDFKIVDGFLYKFLENDSNDFDLHFSWKMVVPSNLIPKILQEFHNNRSHLGYFKTLSSIRVKYYWRFMSKDIKKFVSSCDRCKAAKHNTQISKPPIESQKVAPYPWHTISADLMEKLPRSSNGFSNLLVVSDWFSKMILTHPLRNSASRAICKFLEEQVFLLWGVPKVFISDNGACFKSREMKALLDKYGVTHRFNPAHHPQHNPSERVIRTISGSLRTVLGVDQKKWDTFIPEIGAAIRDAKHKSTKFSPYFVNFGRYMKWSGSDHDHYRKTANQTPHNPLDNAHNLRNIRQTVQDNIDDAFSNYTQYYNLRTRPINFQVGQKVWKRRFKQSKASQNYNAKYDDIYEQVVITKKIGNIYEVRNMKGKALGTVHAKDLKA